MDEEEQAKSVSRQLGVPFASFANKILKMEKGQNLETIVPESFARERLVLPLFLDGEILAVAMADPGNAALIDEIKLVSAQEVQPFISTKTELLKAIGSSYLE
jgi:hypothetical protein